MFTSTRWHKRRTSVCLSSINKSHLLSLPSTPPLLQLRNAGAGPVSSCSEFARFLVVFPVLQSPPFPLRSSGLRLLLPSVPRSSGIPKHLDLLNAKCFRQTMLNRDVAPRCNPRCCRCRRKERERKINEVGKGMEERRMNDEERINGSLARARALSR